MVCSLYLVTGVAAGGRNMGILHGVGNELRTHGKLFIVGGDWHMTAQELVATGWCDLSGAVVVAPAYWVWHSLLQRVWRTAGQDH